ncbi:1,4-beta-xylanase [Terrimonas sp.]|uniref:endo-1,4-beta-xylanase n=1 Tax=Terrimonas sp. TaxID=1914338 RepID=UPI000D50E935|nr:endo-1,4-beta-xylanase [Terrimonas sp.]PVD53562.1 1,4-beta-xylanase [Terrimonas sp.]
MRAKYSIIFFVVVVTAISFYPGKRISAQQILPPLKEVFKKDFLIGTALNSMQIYEKDAGPVKLIPQQFNAVTAENVMKAAEIHPQWNVYQFEMADKLMDYAARYRMKVNGHTLVWHSQLPVFVQHMKDADSVMRFFVDHINTVVGRYKGRIYSWDVVNEALEEDGTLRRSIFLETLGEDYIVNAFRLAQKADPKAKLYYNDYNIEQPLKRAGVIALVKKIQAAGVRIDGIGIQGHWRYDAVPLQYIEESIRAFSSLGLETMITELDLSVLPGPWESNEADINKTARWNERMNPWPDALPDTVAQIQAKAYASLFILLLKYNQQVSRITFWGVNDGQSWLNDWPIKGRTNYPLLFDRIFLPKHAFYSVIETRRK